MKNTINYTEKKLFKVAISEVIVQDYYIEANSEEEAIENASKGYYNCEYVLDGDSDVISRRAKIVTEGEAETEWIDF
ncbi:MAG: DpnD/PcfM family protein [Pseudomonadota bacterium]